MTTEDDFHDALDRNPDDHHTRLVFADFLQERDDPRADGYRALGTIGIRPSLAGKESYRPGYIRGDFLQSSTGWPGHDRYTLPDDWHSLIPHWSGGSMRLSNGWRAGENRRGIEDAAALAFTRLPHARRQELLGQQSAEKLSRRRLARRRYSV